eukprot:1438682-Rhodomonas_salina.1
MVIRDGLYCTAVWCYEMFCTELRYGATRCFVLQYCKVLRYCVVLKYGMALRVGGTGSSGRRDSKLPRLLGQYKTQYQTPRSTIPYRDCSVSTVGPYRMSVPDIAL